MTEGEVAIRLAEYLLSFPGAIGHAALAIDGAVVEISERGRLFEIEKFLAANEWRLIQQHDKPPPGTGAWRGAYERLHSNFTSTRNPAPET
jgi:hypothetical protein